MNLPAFISNKVERNGDNCILTLTTKQAKIAAIVGSILIIAAVALGIWGIVRQAEVVQLRQQTQLQSEQLKLLQQKTEVLDKKIQNLKGTDFLEGVELADGTGLEVSGVFVAIGTAGSTEIARRMGAELTEKGNIRVDEEMRTTIPGLYAAGDCTGGLLQVVKAVYEGAVAGMDASRYTRPEKAPELAAAEATGKRQE